MENNKLDNRIIRYMLVLMIFYFWSICGVFGSSTMSVTNSMLTGNSSTPPLSMFGSGDSASLSTLVPGTVPNNLLDSTSPPCPCFNVDPTLVAMIPYLAGVGGLLGGFICTRIGDGYFRLRRVYKDVKRYMIQTHKVDESSDLTKPINPRFNHEEFLIDTPDREKLFIIFIPMASKFELLHKDKLTILYFKDSVDHIGYDTNFHERFVENIPANFVAISYRGSGRSTGTFDEAKIVQDAKTVSNYIRDSKGLSNHIIFGRGYGAFPAARLAIKSEECVGFVLQDPLASTNRLVRQLADLPDADILASMVVGKGINNEKVMKKIKVPFMLFHNRFTGTNHFGFMEHSRENTRRLGSRITNATGNLYGMAEDYGSDFGSSERSYFAYWSELIDKIEEGIATKKEATERHHLETPRDAVQREDEVNVAPEHLGSGSDADEEAKNTSKSQPTSKGAASSESEIDADEEVKTSKSQPTQSQHTPKTAASSSGTSEGELTFSPPSVLPFDESELYVAAKKRMDNTSKQEEGEPSSEKEAKEDKSGQESTAL